VSLLLEVRPPRYPGRVNGPAAPCRAPRTSSRSEAAWTPVDAPQSGGPGKVDASHVNIGVLVDWFPNPSAGWHVGGTLGFGGARVSDDNISWFGAAAVGGVFGGYDTWIGPDWSLGFSLAASGSPTASLKDSKGNDVGYRLSSGSIALIGTLLYH
jgi:hypothetical protein